MDVVERTVVGRISRRLGQLLKTDILPPSGALDRVTVRGTKKRALQRTIAVILLSFNGAGSGGAPGTRSLVHWR